MSGHGDEQLVVAPGPAGTRRPGPGTLGCSMAACQRHRARAQRGFSVQPRAVDLTHEQEATALYAAIVRVSSRRATGRFGVSARRVGRDGRGSANRLRYEAEYRLFGQNALASAKLSTTTNILDSDRAA